MSETIFDSIPQEVREEFLIEILEAYVERQGLGAMPKGDFDALLVFLYVKHVAKWKYDVFEISEAFRIKESRVRSLIQTGMIKFSEMTEGQAWINILEHLLDSQYELESLEKGQIRFKLDNPTLFRYFQKRVRKIGGTATYHSSSEIVTLTLLVLLKTLDDVYTSSSSEFKADNIDKLVRKKVDRLVKHIGNSIGRKKMDELKTGKQSSSKLADTLSKASELAGIGSLILTLF